MRKIRLPLAAQPDTAPQLPAVLARSASRGEDADLIRLLPNVKAVQTWPLAAAGRSGDAPAQAETAADKRLLALEADNGTTIFIRADALAERVARQRPDAVDGEGDVDLARFRDPDAASRGLGDWLWKQITELQVEPDDIADIAQGKISDWLANKALGTLEDKVVERASVYGARILMETVEARLAGEPGLYQWLGGAPGPGDLCRRDDPRLKGWGEALALVFIHGTGSSTVGSFGALTGNEDWRRRAAVYGDRVFGFEHRSFSESPIDNALALAEVLPDGARIHLVTHSRGGLVGDLLCLGGADERLIGGFRRQPRPDEADAEKDDRTGTLTRLREETAAAEQAKLRQLVLLLDRKNIRVERYVRVACPAAGTALLSGNLEVFFSGLLDLLRKAGAWVAGATTGALTGGVAGAPVKLAVDRGLALLARVVVEIASKRLEAQFVPGIEAMLPESPMGAFLARAPRRLGVAMAVIAGDVEGSGILKRVLVTFTDWRLFNLADNDLVVNTRSMYAGLAHQGARVLFDQGAEVNHFSYFRNPRTRQALGSWLGEAEPHKLAEWSEVVAPVAEPAAHSRSVPLPAGDDPRPILVFLPGIMGSHLEVGRRDPNKPGSGDRIWLDPADLALGGLGKLRIDAADVFADDMLELAYGRLARHLEQTHQVIRFPYDWRKDNLEQGEELAKLVGKVLKTYPTQPIRILAHSMGGLVTRAMIARHPELWEQIVARDGGRLLMLGTPNNGSHLMVETLLGRSDTIRLLGRLDLRNPLQKVLDIVGGFPGALQLLPRPDFEDAGGKAIGDFFVPATWAELANINNDFWFGKRLGAQPATTQLASARTFWTTLAAARQIPHPERIAYIYGQASNTPCGVRLQKNARGETIGFVMLGTHRGDGSVSWASGQLPGLPAERCWLMGADHAGLVSTAAYFREIDALLATGEAIALPRLPASRGEGAELLREYPPGPIPGYPTDSELVTALVGGTTDRPRPGRTSLSVAVRAGDLRFSTTPVLCGHYIGDPIAGAEAIIDRHVVGGALSRRERMGVHAGPLGSASVVLMPPNREEALRNTCRGALVVGLGEFGELHSGAVRETVCAGVLRLLLHAAERAVEQGGGQGSALELRLASVLLGYNSTTTISVDEAVAAVTLGVADANRQFDEGVGSGAARITELEFIEIFEDAAITAARAVTRLPETQDRALKSMGVQLSVHRELRYGKGARPRLSVNAASGYWPRLMITEARCEDDGPASLSSDPPTTPPTRRRYPDRLRYLFLSERARAESVEQQRQPGLVEKLVADTIRNTAYDPELGIGRSLFHLLVPLGFKSAARETTNLMLVLDPYTAKLPWEMLEADGEPLVLKTRMVRQLASKAFRPVVRSSRQPQAYVISNPSTAGYFAEFGGGRLTPAGDKDELPDLRGADAEGEALFSLLDAANYHVEWARKGSSALEVIGRLFKKPYRILAVAAHGMYQVSDRDGQPRSGVILSNGLMLTAAEVGQMEVVPELVFLSCCHLGGITDAPNKLAYSLSRELIEMGVRCVVAAGWEVDDQAALTFSRTFFEHMLCRQASFGEAIFQARQACHQQHPGLNTWGAYQAYGDPAFTLDTPADTQDQGHAPVSPAELVDWLRTRTLDAARAGGGKTGFAELTAQVRARLAAAPGAWNARADVQFALGELYGEWGEDGFEAACEAYRAAIAAESPGAPAPLKAAEQLANLQARRAQKLADKGHTQDALKRVGEAIRILEHLRQLDPAGDGAPHPNRERAALLGSAHKRHAAILAKAAEADTANADQGARPKPASTAADPSPAPADGSDTKEPQASAENEAQPKTAAAAADPKALWDGIKTALTAARDAYRNAEGRPDEPGFNPYTMINRLQLDAVLGDPPLQELDALVDHCQKAARQRYTHSRDFWDGIMPVDAELARLLGQEAAPPPDSAATLREDYQSQVAALSPTHREWDSVVKQIQLLASFLQARSKAGDTAPHLRDKAKLLKDLAEELERAS